MVHTDYQSQVCPRPKPAMNERSISSGVVPRIDDTGLEGVGFSGLARCCGGECPSGSECCASRTWTNLGSTRGRGGPRLLYIKLRSHLQSHMHSFCAMILS